MPPGSLQERDETLAVNSYCQPTLLYGCQIFSSDNHEVDDAHTNYLPKDVVLPDVCLSVCNFTQKLVNQTSLWETAFGSRPIGIFRKD